MNPHDIDCPRRRLAESGDDATAQGVSFGHPFEVSPMFTPFVRRFAWLVVALAAFAPVGSEAALFCVATGNEFQVALDIAGASGASDEIRLTSGVKQRVPINGNFAWAFASTTHHDLAISGGWNGNCTSQNLDPRSTVLNGSATAPILSVSLQGSSAAGIRISNLSFEHAVTPNFSLAAALDVDARGSATPAVEIDRIVARLNSTASQNGTAIIFRQADSATGTYALRNSLIEANTTRALRVSSRSGAVVYVNNNTITANQPANGSATVVDIGGPGTVWMANNVVAGNLAASDVAISAGSVTFLRNNHIGSLVGSPSSNQGMTTGPALLAVDGDGWWRPQPGSPLRDSGYSSPNGGVGSHDIARGPRVQGLRVDRGAIETDGDLLFANGFQTLP